MKLGKMIFKYIVLLKSTAHEYVFLPCSIYCVLHLDVIVPLKNVYLFDNSQISLHVIPISCLWAFL